MKQLKTLLVIASIIISLSACTSNNTIDSENTLTTVSASIFPIYNITKQIGGGKIQAHLLIKPGESPHTFEPTITTKNNINNSKRVFVIGHQLDDWVTKLVDIKSKIVRLDKNISLMEFEDEDHSDHEDEDDHNDEEHSYHAHGQFNPHYWLAPNNGIQIGFTIKEELKRLDSKNSDYYENNYKIFKSSVDNLSDQLIAQSSPINQTPFVTLHQAWGYYKKAFNLNIVGSFEPEGAEEPTPKYLKELQNIIKQENVKVIFSEPQLSTTSLSAFIDDNDLSIGIMDPIGGSGDIDSYQKILQYNMNTLLEKLERN